MSAAMSAAAASAAASPPKWVMLERFVFRMDEAFPDEDKLPIRASGITRWEAPFDIAFELAEPPAISRLYARLPGFPDPLKQVPLAILASHQHLVLFRVCIEDDTFDLRQELFIYSASDADDPSKLKALPACMDYPLHGGGRGGRRRRRRRPPPNKEQRPRLMAVRSMGILCRDQQEFVVAELRLFRPGRCPDPKVCAPEVFADIFWLHKLAVPTGAIEGKWNSCRVPIRSFCKKPDGNGILGFENPDPDDTWQLCIWQTDTVIPVGRWLCWIDYYRGILFCDVFGDPTPTVSFLRFPLDEFPIRGKPSSWLYRGASDVGGRKLKFVDIARHDGVGYGALKTSVGGFTITCHTLSLESMEWKKDYTVTSKELWSANAPKDLPRHILMFPQVDIYRPHVVHFLCCDYEYVMMKMWVVTIDMSTRIVESCSQYLNGLADLHTDKIELTQVKSAFPLPFLSSEFSKFLSRPWAPAARVLTRASVTAPSAASFKTHGLVDVLVCSGRPCTPALRVLTRGLFAAPSSASFTPRGLVEVL
ncbi:hypothetical protein BDA96_01G066100 [Sorghum bicolor]|uniref:DUF1618 domain-containing protein n=2 Tax=Sorghum bicolor TaxID=4558 RepID=A0A921RX92_SORBI|nr:hypothetical protein BDA96_01G066100 [Sorghum bicolor]KXG37396.1 hypothetical protein SORBI_3001G064000 [Sorghum bicolor]